MKYELETGAHSAYSLHYHLILTTKYRQGVLTEDRIDFMRQAIENFADRYNVAVGNIDGGDDHVHLLFSASPTTELSKFVNAVKGSTSRRLRNEYDDELAEEVWGDGLWTDSYCLISTGQVSLDVLMRYVERQRERHGGA